MTDLPPPDLDDELPDAIAVPLATLYYVVDACDDLGVVPTCRWLAAALDGEDPGLAVGVCLNLGDAWENPEQGWPDDDAATTEHRRAVIRDVAAALAGFAATADPAATIWLEILLREDPPQAASVALDLLDQVDFEPSDALGEVIVRAIVTEATRADDAREKLPARLAAGLAHTVEHPGWLPEGLEYGSLAAIASWTHFLRDDHATAMQLLEVAQAHPANDPFTAGLVAILGIMDPEAQRDPVELERRLRASREAVERSGDPQLITMLRAAGDMLARSRLQRFGDSVSELASTNPGGEYADLTLMLDTMEQLGRQRLDPSIRERLHAWRTSGRTSEADLSSAALLWGMSAAIATIDHDLIAARTYLAEARTCRQQIEYETPHTAALDAMLDSFDATAMLVVNPRAGLAAMRAARDRQKADGLPFLATVTEGQYAIAALSQGHPGEALVASVRAYDRQRGNLANLAGSSERAATLGVLAGLRLTMLQAAGEVGDPRTLAEVLEFLRAQATPTASADPDDDQLPLGSLVPPAVGTLLFFPLAPDLDDAVAIAPPAPVRMPWGTIALESLIGGTDAVPAPLVVPR